MAKNIKNYEHFIPPTKLRPDMPGGNEHILVKSIEELRQIFDTKFEFISLDFETSGLSPEVDFIVGYSFAFSPHKGYYVPVKHAHGISLGNETLDMLYQVVMKAKRVFLYNARFDMRFFEWAGYDLSKMKYFDVMKGIWFADTNVKMPSLKWSERHFLGWDPSTFEQTLGDAPNFYYLDPEDGYEYACIPGDEKVLTSEGAKCIKDIVVGDSVETSKGLRKVKGFYSQGLKELYRIKFSGGEFQATSNHRVAVESVLGPVYVEVCNLNKYSKFYQGNLEIRELRENVHKKTKKEMRSRSWKLSSVQDFEACYYLLGFAMADGCLIGNRLSFHLQKRDKELLEMFQERFGSEAKIRPHDGVSPSDSNEVVEGIEISFTSVILEEFLRNHGMTENKQTRENYYNVPEEYLRDFLRGFYDGDGSSNGYNMVFCCNNSLSKKIAEDLKRVLGIDYRDYLERDNTGYLDFGRSESVKLYQWMYNNCSIYLKRKRDKALKSKWNFCKLISKEGVITYWSSSAEAARYAGVSISAISAVILGKRRHARGWRAERIDFIPIECYKRSFDEVEVFKSGLGEVYDINIEETHNYKLECGVISHNCVDAEGTFALVPTAVKYYKEARLSGQLDNEILYPLMKWENQGIRVDIDYLSKKIEELTPELHRIEQEIYSEVGYQFALKSPKQLGDALESVGITTGEYTKSGQMKTDIGTLTALFKKLGDTPETKLLTNIVRYSKLIKLLSSFFESLRNEAIRQGGRCRFSYIDCNVPTGRLASGSDKKNPFFTHMNVQAISKPHPKMWYVHDGSTISDEDLRPGEVRVLDWVFSMDRKSDKWEEGFEQDENVRSAFLPEEGHYWVSIDFNAQELRIPAALSGEPAWKEAFVHGVDPHRSTAEAIWGKENYDKDKRKKAKIMNFGCQYGGNKYTVQSKLGIDDLDECEKLVNDWRQGLPTLHAWQNAMVRRVKKTGTVYSYFGRPRRVKHYLNSPDSRIRAFGVRTVKNSVVQGTGADLTKIGMLKLWKKLLNPELKTGCRFLNTIHDEVNISIPKDPAVFHKYLAIARSCMRIQVPGWPFPMETGIEIGDAQGRAWAFKVDDEGNCTPKWEDVPKDKPEVKVEVDEGIGNEEEINIFTV